MAFMVPTVLECDWIECADPEDQSATSTYPASDYETEFGEIREQGTGFLFRLSAPGYMDCTDWSRADTEEEARAELESMYDCCPYCGEDIEDSSEIDETESDPALCQSCDTLLPSSKGERGVWYYSSLESDDGADAWLLCHTAPTEARAEIISAELQSLGGSSLESDGAFLYCIGYALEEATRELESAGFSVQEQG